MVEHCFILVYNIDAEYVVKFHTQQKSYSISHLLGTVTTQCLESDGVVTIVNCQQHSDYTVV